ncbi:MAG TPA: hypothetical protein VFG63_16260, partial [Nocardioidaceae bacterium]|nr:hypothetical protein [Nocardioidaceae bacterium]
RVADAGSLLWAGGTGDRLPRTYDGPLEAWLLPILALAVIGIGVVLARTVRALDPLLAPLANPALGVAFLTAAAVGTAASYPVPVWLVCVLLLAPAVAFVAWALPGEDLLGLAVGSAFGFAGLGVSLHDEWLTSAALLVLLGLSTLVHLRWNQVEARTAAGVVLPAALAGSVWTWGALADADETWTTVVALLALAALVLAGSAVARLHGLVSPGVESGAAVSAFIVGLAGVAHAPVSEGATWTAVYLTLAGVAVCALSLLREDRRLLGWVGGLLLAMASWVRLWDIGVEAPEAYTLPSAAALAVVGLLHLRRDRRASTMTALGPALGLALVPSLLWVLWEPATLRSVLLGAGCLLLLVAGLRMRWTGPVVFAATVGACVVLRHAGPFVDEAVPRWVLIATAGALLIGMGISWEQRMQDARKVLGYVRALR